ncbi:MAG: endonuclease III domain-containing protein [Nanoarchaeota archaeon]
MDKKNLIKKIYYLLLNNYGFQGWWPLLNLKNSENGYHLNDYNYPKNKKQIFEICLGALLTQNTTWKNANKAIINLHEINAINPKKLIELNDIKTVKLLDAIKPAGYYNQKLKKIIIFSKYFINLNEKIPTKIQLLNLWGIGDETADSILLYAFKKPSFVIDTYTKRIFSRIGICNDSIEYINLQNIFQNSFINESYDNKIQIYNEYHALIVLHAKNFCTKKPKCNDCILKKECLYAKTCKF